MGKVAPLLAVFILALSCGQGARRQRTPLTPPEAYYLNHDARHGYREWPSDRPSSTGNSPDSDRSPAVSSFEAFRVQLEDRASFAPPSQEQTYHYRNTPESAYSGGFSRTYDPSSERRIHTSLRWIVQRAASGAAGTGYSQHGNIHYIRDGNVFYGISFEDPLFANPVVKLNPSDGSGYQIVK